MSSAHKQNDAGKSNESHASRSRKLCHANSKHKKTNTRASHLQKSKPSRKTHNKKRNKKTSTSPARLVAYNVLSQVEANNSFTRNVLDAQLKREREKHDLSAEDAAFATTLALGVTQSIGALDYLIDRALKNPHDIRTNVRIALRISTYEIIYLKKDAFATTHQGVELVRSFCPKAAGVANFVLRRVCEAKGSFPFGDPERDLRAFAFQEAFPPDLVQLFVRDLGQDYAKTLMHAANTPAPVFIAVNYARATDEEVCEKLSNSNIAFEKVETVNIKPTRAEQATEKFANASLAGCYKFQDARSITHPQVKKLIGQGKILVADASAQLIAQSTAQHAFNCCNPAQTAENCDSAQTTENQNSAQNVQRSVTSKINSQKTSQPAPSVLEIGSGRATKTILLQSNAQRTQNKFINLTCVDNSEYKMNILRNRVREYGVPVAHTLVADATMLDENLSTPFDLVFLDAPCTGLGTLRRHPEIRWRITPDTIRNTAHLQQKMLTSVAPLVHPGGVLVYSTCTVTHAENEENITAFLKSAQGKHFRLMSSYSTITHPASSDAHFVALLQKVI